MYKRTLYFELLEQAKKYPVVTLIGPRQSGKTTLVRYAFPNKPYINLEALDLQEIARLDPRSFLEKYPEGAILDEIQRVPSLLSYIQIIVDSSLQMGMFILTGSHQLELHQAIVQSLAGRTALLTLLPLSLAECREADLYSSLNESLLKGGYPRIYKDNLDPTKAYKNYFQTYVERDVRQLVNVHDLLQFQQFMRICASRVGRIITVEGIANDAGISSKTVKSWLSILEASFIIFRLQPYFENFGKRIIKSPKLYFTDVGFVSFLLGIETSSQMSRDPLRGSLVENLIVLEMMKTRMNIGLDSNLYYFRDAHGHEIDVIFKAGTELIPIEIKCAKTFNKDFLKNIIFFQKLVGTRFSKGFVLYNGDTEQKIGQVHVLNFAHLQEIM